MSTVYSDGRHEFEVEAGAYAIACKKGKLFVPAQESVIVPFNTTGAGASGTLTGTFTSTNTATISNDSLDVLMRTGKAYVNLHTDLNKGGEIRGQLSQQQ